MDALLPLLRSPPFPRVDPTVGAVSQSLVQARTSIEPADLFERIGRLCIGGTFWARQPNLPDEPFTLICARSAWDARRMMDGIAASKIVVHLSRRERLADIITWSGPVDPWPAMMRAQAVHAHGDSEWAALAKIAGRPMTLHSAGIFDTAEKVRRALLTTTYRNPFTGRPADIEFAIEQLAEWRALIDANRTIVAASGIAWWKRREVNTFLWAARSRPLLITGSAARALARAKREGGAIALWPSRAPRGLIHQARLQGTPLVRIEDGFIRSVGLGSNLFPPLSVAVDTRGIYYDPAQPSDLEHLLETTPFTPKLLERADALRRHLIAAGISKYGANDGDLPERRSGRRLILVPGQVEDDESVRLGGGDVSSNRELLRRARALEPDAEIWFRPHPDVDAGHRTGLIPDADALRLADRVVRGGSMARLLDIVDGLHVLSSLAGFEGLIRRREVVVHGSPFYAGWGLTRDIGPVPARRQRRLDVLQLIAGTLILYPRYLDPITRLPCPVEVLVSRFEAQSGSTHTWLSRIREVQGRLTRSRL